MTNYFPCICYAKPIQFNNLIIFLTFTLMIKHFKIFLLILISFCYGITVFEISDTEKKSNFENESHVYLPQHHDYSFKNADLQTIPHFDITSAYPICFYFDSDLIPTKDCLIYQKNFLQPPDRLFVLYSSFLI